MRTARHDRTSLRLMIDARLVPVDSITVNDARFDLRRAVEADLPALVALLSDDPRGAARESTTMEPYQAVGYEPSHEGFKRPL